MQRFADVVQNILTWVCATLLAVLGALVFYQVLSRYLSWIPSFLWTEEISRGLLIWAVMLGAGLAVFEETHFRLSVMEDVAPRAFRLIGRLGSLAGGIYLVSSSLTFVQRGAGRVSQVSGLPAYWIYSALLVGGVLIVIGALLRLAGITNQAGEEA
ncbi:TRAP transporter small permease [Paracoccus sp. M683]|uniref:TRAP transporter small permease n=1 Tax=Paracoccus sp. M683 TaxID=2594268 RepID=UPI0011800812|nr:TRAP transporter small permease [Paracoccus sp. M683]TRW99251.1 TRAP transporter small permease [Paracoccus sp. M683]